MKTALNSFVVSHIDYCNCLLAGERERERERERESRVLCDRLHWLPVEQKIQYKLCLLVYKAHCGLAPQYLVDFVSLCQLSVAEVDYDRHCPD